MSAWLGGVGGLRYRNLISWSYSIFLSIGLNEFEPNIFWDEFESEDANEFGDEIDSVLNVDEFDWDLIFCVAGDSGFGDGVKFFGIFNSGIGFISTSPYGFRSGFISLSQFVSEIFEFQLYGIIRAESKAEAAYNYLCLKT
ncbi:hypothetical protein BpHYR1_025864 [Brachionus plicatilis]|uniref:Uncharacterized protein n=1 Tax=Brachionus plicatilis TaxID=10195 RepID=A0A3M7RDD1_BRAPC|nr:hypothetical protein BpHYR1_025864 [Brachionus plicatilis]